MVEDGVATVRQTSWRLMAERGALGPAVFDAWSYGSALPWRTTASCASMSPGAGTMATPTGAGNSVEQSAACRHQCRCNCIEPKARWHPRFWAESAARRGQGFLYSNRRQLL